MGPARWTPAALLLAVLLAHPARAQETPARTVTLEVRQVAGENVYLDLGTGDGLQQGDTLEVRDGEAGPVLGRLVVAAATATRTVLTFVGPPFPLRSGDRIAVVLPRDAAPGETPAAGGAPAPAAPTPRRSPDPPRLTGRATLEVAVNHATTGMGAVDPLSVSRTLATPALRLDATARGLPGGFTLRTRGRVSHRYTTGTSYADPTAVQVDHLSLERRFTRLPAQLTLGRFYSPAESFSGVWDGVALRVGPDGFGAGFLVGFEPDLWNRTPTLDLPKATLFADWRTGEGGLRWDGEVSAHLVSPRMEGVERHLFLGVGQRLTAGPLRLRAQLQADRDPADGGVRVSEAVGQATLSLGPVLSVRAGASRRESYTLLAPVDPFGPRRDRVGGGLTLRFGGALLSGDYALNRYPAGGDRDSWTGALTLPRLPGLPRVGWSAHGSWWSGEADRALTAGSSFTVPLSRARLRAGYRYHATTVQGRRRVSHAPDLYLDLPVGEGLSLTLRTRAEFGERLRSQSLHLSLTRVF